MNQPIVWMSINFKSGGTRVRPDAPLLERHGDLDMARLHDFHQIIGLAPQRPHAIFVQEAKWWDRHAAELLHYVERQLRATGYGIYRGFLTRSHRSHHHQAVFIDTDRLQATHHWRGDDPDESRGLYGYVQVIIDDDETRPVLLKSVHLDPRDGSGRLADARQLHAVVKPGRRAIVAGDWNSSTSRRSASDGEPQRDHSVVPIASRYHKGTWPPTLPNGDTTTDTRALDYLVDTGWIDQHTADHCTVPTTTSNYDRGGGLIIDRCLTRGALTTVPGSVWVDESDLDYSDHRAVSGALTVTDGPAGDAS